MFLATILLMAAGGALLGAVVLSLLAVLSFALFAREAFGDGQFSLIFLFTVPYGGVIGAVAAVTAAFIKSRRVATGAWTSIAGGTGIGALFVLIVWVDASGRKGGMADFLSSLFSPLGGAPFLWPLALVAWGVWLLRKR